MEKPSGSLISFMANKVKREGGINLAQGIPAFNPPKELLQCLEEIVHKNIHQYAPGKGNQDLLEALAEHYKLPQSQFLVTNGATEAISLLVTFLLKKIGESFSVLAFDPVYESYKHLPRIFSLPFYDFKMDENNHIDFLKLEKLLVEKSIKLILLASPGNPVGKVFSRKELDTLLELCNKHKVYVIIDAVYSDLYFNEAPYYPTCNLSEFVFYVNAFSKKFSITGWRIGYLIAHESNMLEIMDVHDYTGLCAPSILQQALANYIGRYDFGKLYILNLREKLIANYNKMICELEALGFCVLKAQGGYFIWTKLPNQYGDGLEFALKLYEQEKVAVVPGIHFSENGRKLIRLNIARNASEIDEAILGIKRFLKAN